MQNKEHTAGRLDSPLPPSHGVTAGRGEGASPGHCTSPCLRLSGQPWAEGASLTPAFGVWGLQSQLQPYLGNCGTVVHGVLVHGTDVLQEPVGSHRPAHLWSGEEEESEKFLGTCLGPPLFFCAGFIVFSKQSYRKAALVLSDPEVQSQACSRSVPSATLWQWDPCPGVKGRGWGEQKTPHRGIHLPSSNTEGFPSTPNDHRAVPHPSQAGWQ